MKVSFDILYDNEDMLRHDGIRLSAESPGVVRDACGVPVEWTLLKIGENPIVKNGRSGSISLSAADAGAILEYFKTKGEEIPVDSKHYLHELANRKGLDEAEVLRLLPDGIAAMGFGSLALSGDELRFRVKWTPLAYELMKEKIFRYFSPALRGMVTPPLRITSVAMENEPAINNLDALAAGANLKPSDQSDTTRRANMPNKFTKSMMHLLHRDSIALGADATEEDKDKIACEVEEKASLIDQVATLLGLKPDASVDEVVAALKAQSEKAESADEKQEALDEMAASAEKRVHADLVAKGRTESKIVDADMEYVNSLDSKALAAALPHMGRKVPLGRITQPARKSDSVALSAIDRVAIDSLRNAGIADAETEYLKRKEGK